MSTATEQQAHVGHPPRSPERLSRREWLAALKRSFTEFLADDCMGMSQQIAYSSLLAFFPAMAFLVGALGIFDLYDDVIELLDPIAPQGVIDFISTLQQDSSEGASVAAFVHRVLRSRVGGKRRDGIDHQGSQPRLRAPGDARRVEGAADRDPARDRDRDHDRRRLPPDRRRRRRSAMRSPRRPGSAPLFDLTWGILRWPVAFCAILLFFALIYFLAPNADQRNWKWVTPGSVLGGLLWLVLSGLFALYVTFAGNYTKTYGTIASGIILLLWLNYSAFALLYGAELNSELDKQADIRAAGGERAGLVTLA